MLKGIDVSKWQNVGSYGDSVELGHTDFMIAKATEGATGVDVKFSDHIQYALNHNMLIGAYHYARPDNGNKPEAEARNFVTALNNRDLVGKCLMALDWEGKSLNYNEDWALAWLSEVYKLTGVKPLIYMSSSNTHRFDKLPEYDFGLWVANWSKEPESAYIHPWAFKAIWQKRGEPLDLDIFYGDVSAWNKYAKPIELPTIQKEETETKEDCDNKCGCELLEELQALIDKYKERRK